MNSYQLSINELANKIATLQQQIATLEQEDNIIQTEQAKISKQRIELWEPLEDKRKKLDNIKQQYEYYKKIKKKLVKILLLLVIVQGINIMIKPIPFIFMPIFIGVYGGTGISSLCNIVQIIEHKIKFKQQYNIDIKTINSKKLFQLKQELSKEQNEVLNKLEEKNSKSRTLQYQKERHLSQKRILENQIQVLNTQKETIQREYGETGFEIVEESDTIAQKANNIILKKKRG